MTRLTIRVRLADSGGVPALRRPLRRGERRSTGSSGAGLGLAIVDAVVTARHAAWTLLPRDGGGRSVTVTLPAR